MNEVTASKLIIERRELQGVGIVCPVGKLDTLTAKSFEESLKQEIEAGGGALLIDMSAVDYVTSFGLRSILIIRKLLAPFGRKLILFSLNPSVMEVLRVSGFLKIVAVAETEADALALV